MTTTVVMTDLVVRDGSTVCVRQGDERDVFGILQFLQSLSPQSLYFRFHGRPALTETRIRQLLGLAGHPAMTLLAESGGRIVAFASYHRDSSAPDRAEVAFAVSDAVP